MKMFLFKSFCLLAMLFISVLAGIQIADEGIHHMKGSSHSTNLNAPIYQNQQSLAKTESINNDIQAKQQRLEKMNAFNIFSFMGEKMSNGITEASAKILKSIVH